MAFPARTLLAVCIIGVLGGCSSLGKEAYPPPLRAPKQEVDSGAALDAGLDQPARSRERFESGRLTPVSPVPRVVPEPELVVPVISRERDVALALDGVPIEAFINVLYAMELGFPVQVDAALRNRRELLSLNLTRPRPPAEAYRVGAEVLRSYGVRISELGGVLRFESIPDNRLPENGLIATRSLPEVPAGQRTVFVAMPLDVAQPGAVAGQVRSLYGDQSLKFTELPESNAILIQGPGDAVRSAMSFITTLDQPAFGGMRSIRINPSYLSAELLAKELKDVLAGEGIRVRSGPGDNAPLTFVPVGSANALIVFGASETALAAAQSWAERLDQPSDSDGGGVYMYAGKHTPVETMLPVLQAMVGGSTASGANTTGVSQTGGGSAGSAGTGNSRSGGGGARSTVISGEGGQLAIDPVRNVIVFQGDAQRWRSIQGILARLDQPARQVLIEVTIAEVTLSDELSHGVEWALRNISVDGLSGPLTALSGGSVQAGGLTWRALSSSGQVQAALNLFANDSRVTILSTPRILVKSGEMAQIDVGTEVPIVTSQATAPDLPSSGSSILQSIQYRKTGTILEIEPVIHSGSRVDLKVTQEVSEAAVTNTSDISSPSIFSRRLQTSLSLSDGEGTLLGGLISANGSDGKTKVPLLGDIPLLGKAFQSRTRNRSRTELLMLITPYVVEDSQQARAITEAVRNSMPLHDRWEGAPVVPAALPSADGQPQRLAPAQEVPAQEVPAQEVPAQEVPATDHDGQQTPHALG